MSSGGMLASGHRAEVLQKPVRNSAGDQAQEKDLAISYLDSERLAFLGC